MPTIARVEIVRLVGDWSTYAWGHGQTVTAESLQGTGVQLAADLLGFNPGARVTVEIEQICREAVWNRASRSRIAHDSGGPELSCHAPDSRRLAWAGCRDL